METCRKESFGFLPLPQAYAFLGVFGALVADSKNKNCHQDTKYTMKVKMRSFSPAPLR